jgi:hypothetical protein
MYQRGSYWETFPWNLILRTSINSCRKNSDLVKIGQNIGHFTRRREYILLLPAALNRYKSSFFDWNSIRMLSKPRRYKHYASTLQCYAVLTLSVLNIRAHIIDIFASTHVGLRNYKCKNEVVKLWLLDMKACRNSRGISALILHSDTKLCWVKSPNSLATSRHKRKPPLLSEQETWITYIHLHKNTCSPALHIIAFEGTTRQ